MDAGGPDRTRIVARVEKLLGLARSDNAHESAAAAAAAQRLIERHAIAQAEIEAARAGRAHDGHEPLAVVPRDRDDGWLDKLATAIADATGCFAFREERAGGEGPIALRAAGRDDDVALCRALFAWCRAEVDRIVLAAAPVGRGRSIGRRSLVFGAVDRIAAEIARERPAHAGRDGIRALVPGPRRDRPAGEQARAAAGKLSGRRRIDLQLDRRSYLHGFDAARDVYRRGRRRGIV